MDLPIEKKKPMILTENTLLPLSLVASVVLFSVWIANIQSSAAQNREQLAHLRNEMERQRNEFHQNQKELSKHLLSIDTRLSFIQGAISAAAKK